MYDDFFVKQKTAYELRSSDWRSDVCSSDLTLLEQQFRPFAVSNAGDREGLFTGYYEAELKAAASPTAPRATPLYRLPDDLVTVDRSEARRVGQECVRSCRSRWARYH